jgi:hypothetical protein
MNADVLIDSLENMSLDEPQMLTCECNGVYVCGIEITTSEIRMFFDSHSLQDNSKNSLLFLHQFNGTLKRANIITEGYEMPSQEITEGKVKMHDFGSETTVEMPLRESIRSAFIRYISQTSLCVFSYSLVFDCKEVVHCLQTLGELFGLVKLNSN